MWKYFILRISATFFAHFHIRNGEHLSVCRHPVLYSMFTGILMNQICTYGEHMENRLKSRERWAPVQLCENKCNSKFMVPAIF